MFRKRLRKLISLSLVRLMTLGSISTALSAEASPSPGATGSSQERLTPIMGWSSWNEYANRISEDIFLQQMDLMKEYGLIDVGYTFFNCDDGYQMGRDPETGLVRANTEKFPHGMKYIADYAHSLGMQAGIYSDAGDDTCASRANGEGNTDYHNKPGTGFGLGVGLYQHDEEDLRQYFEDWGFDFLKVDWCGGQHVGWNDSQRAQRYIEIGNEIEALRQELGRDLIYNVCCWTFPGENVVNSPCDSWRTGGDLWANWNSILSQIDVIKNGQLWKYSCPGKANDLDMMQVGRGLTYEEDKTHFSMWCMMSSPLMIGADLTKITPETLEILKNEEMIAIDQDPACIGAVYLSTANNVEIWSKDLGEAGSATKAIALMNRSDAAQTVTVSWKELSLYGNVEVRDLWQHKYLNVGSSYTVTVPAHGTVVWKVTGQEAGAVQPPEMERNAQVSVGEKSKTVNLTQLGTGDWLHYGNVNGVAARRKKDVPPQLQYTGSQLSNPSASDYYTDAYTAYSWSDGTDGSSGSTKTGMTVGKTIGAYGQITAPADSRQRTLYVPITGWRSTVRIDISLGGQVMHSETVSPTKLTDAYNRVNKLVTVTYSTSEPTTLTVTWTIVEQEVSNGNIAVEAAALTAVTGENPAAPLADSGFIGGFTAKDRVENQGALLLDVRSAEEFAEGHLVGAVNLPYGEIFARAEELLPDKSREIIVYCLTGKRSAQARANLLYLGYTNVSDLGSMEHWDSVPQLVFTNYAKMILPSQSLTISVNGAEYDKTTLGYAIGKEATANEAVPYHGAFTLEHSDTVKAFLFFTNSLGEVQVIAQAESDYLVFENKIPDLSGLEITYCSDLIPTGADVAYSTVLNNRSTDNHTITIGGRAFDKGISAHAPSAVTYAIPEGVNRFVAAAGCDDEVGNRDFTIIYSILIDGKQIGPAVTLDVKMFYVFDLPIPAGAKELTLVAKQGNSSLHKNDSMHSEWGISAFVQDPADQDAKLAEAVDKQIEAIGPVTSLAQKEAVQVARAAFDALTDRQKLLVPHKTQLLDAEAAIAALEGDKPNSLLGDLNDDNTLTVTDVVLLRKAILGGTPSEDTLRRGDMNTDKTLTVTDVVLLRKAILNTH